MKVNAIAFGERPPTSSSSPELFAGEVTNGPSDSILLTGASLGTTVRAE